MIKKFNFPVKGMTCQHCVKAVSDALESLSGVEDIQVDLDANEVVIEADDQEFDSAKAAEAVKNAGYELIIRR